MRRVCLILEVPIEEPVELLEPIVGMSADGVYHRLRVREAFPVEKEDPFSIPGWDLGQVSPATASEVTTDA